MSFQHALTVVDALSSHTAQRRPYETDWCKTFAYRLRHMQLIAPRLAERNGFAER
ncbi:hypothetical protein [Beijerinckia sp. L45]|uniref:hypothetical protein n=1 Tax=Beijerinckia sp. L45 TaxID=1641855 RepID=UPI00131C5684|nr:hypothetical protein [Beijerinckia sp. L45]